VFPIRVGTLVCARRNIDAGRAGEHGVCYRVDSVAGRARYGVLFERGGYCEVSREIAYDYLTVSNRVCPAVAGYRFTDAGQLERDFETGRFADAFSNQRWKDCIVPGRPGRRGPAR
jgi:hypothetical protein